MFWRKKTADAEFDLSQKFGSIALFLSIPASLVLGGWFTGTFISLLFVVGIDRLLWALFAHAVILAIYLFSGPGLQRARTILHELKHLMLVIITGNKFMDMRIGADRGHVSYEVYDEKLHLEPFVILAPYFYPLLSLPVLALAIVFDISTGGHFHVFSAYLLGLALGIDEITAVREITPHQTDLQRIWGGYLTTRAFILSFHFMWCAICLLWVAGGWKGYAQALFIVGRLFSETIP